jgi:hypothetical protein
MSTTNYYSVKARQIVRAFFRKPALTIYTGTGRANRITGNTEEAVYFTTGGGSNRISKAKIEAAVARLLLRRSLKRKDLERFSAFSSALLGLLRHILPNLASVFRNKLGALVLKLRGTQFCFSGIDRAKRDFEVAVDNGAEIAFVSFANVRNDRTEKFIEYSKGKPLVVDSGAFSVWNGGKEPICIYSYIDFIKRHESRILYYMNLDVIGDPAASHQNAQVMREQGLDPVKVWHINFNDTRIEAQNWDLLDEMVAEGRWLIGIGGAALTKDVKRAPIFRECFRRYPAQGFHTLGCGSKILFEFLDEGAGPLFTDARSWAKGRENGRTLTRTGQKTGLLDGIEAMAHNVRILASLALL